MVQLVKVNGGATNKLQEGQGLSGHASADIPPGAGGAMGMSERAKMEISVEKYLEMRFGPIEDSLKELRADVRELRGWKLWIVGTGVASFIGIVLIMIAFYTYHANVMQSQLSAMQSQLSGIQSQMSLYQSQLNAQMQTFTEYVKAVTQSQPPEERKPSKK